MYFIFLEVILSFILRGSNLFEFIFMENEFSLSLLQEAIGMTILWLLVTEFSVRFSVFTKKYSISLEVNILVLSFLILIFTTGLKDLWEINVVTSDISQYVFILIFLYASIFSVGNIASVIYNRVMDTERALLDNIELHQSKLSQLQSSQEIHSIEYLTSLIETKNYAKVKPTKKEKPYLGLQYDNLSIEKARKLGLEDYNGIYITNI